MNNPFALIAFAVYQTSVDFHYHQTYQVVVRVNQHSFECNINGVEYKEMSGFVLRQGVGHACTASDTRAMVLLVDTESSLGWQLKQMLGDEDVLRIESLLTPDQLLSLQIPDGDQPDHDKLFERYQLLLNLLFSPAPNFELKARMDSRVLTMLNYIDANIGKKIELDDIARLVFLSPERVRHLFAKEAGISFSQYILWERVKNVICSVMTDNIPIKKAAAQSGFTDQAHFSKIFKRMFGMSARPVLKNSRFIQFLNPDVRVPLCDI